MDKRTVIVTGGSRGIGEAISTRFAKEGYNVVINYVSNDERASKLKKDLEEKYNADILLVKADVSNEDDAKRLIDEAVNKFGAINCLVNNEGIAIDKPFLDKTKDDFMKTLSTNLVGPFLTSKFAYNYLINASNAAIVNISSTNALDTYYPESIDYDASKAGIISLTHNFAKYLNDIRVNCICPDWIDTEMNQEMAPDYRKKINFIKKEDLALLVYKVATNKSINDQIIKVGDNSVK